ncbi:MAG: tetratricopeptide repeat protein [Armatimonadetes bacterium]|nr:tetratricopeptide repeat protein [Armatimonadota bacterium]
MAQDVDSRGSHAQDAELAEEMQSEQARPGDWDDAFPQDFHRAEELINLATEALAAGQRSQALTYARQATEAAPGHAGAWMLLGMVAREAGMPEEALMAYRQAAEIDPDRPGLAEELAAAEQAASAPPPPPGLLEKIQTQVLERHAPALLAAAVGLLVLALGITAIRAHQRSLTEARFQQLLNEGIQYMAVQQYDRAEANFTEALRLKPNDPQALNWLNSARDARQKLAKYEQWQYETLGGRFPGVTPGSGLSSGQIPATEEQAPAEGQGPVQQPGAMPSGDYSSRRYTWRGAESPPETPSSFPSPRAEMEPGPEGPQPVTSSQPPAPTQPPGASQGAAGNVPSPGQPPPGSGQSTSGAPASPPPPAPVPQEAKGYIRITVGEPRTKPTGGGSPSPTADAVRQHADSLAAMGRTQEAKQAYQQAIELYEREAEADPEARAVKRAGAESCRRAMDQLD